MRRRNSVVEERPQTPAGRTSGGATQTARPVTLRNRLLNFHPSKQTAYRFCPDVSRLEDRLADGRADAAHLAFPMQTQLAIVMRNYTRNGRKRISIGTSQAAPDRDEVALSCRPRDLDVRPTRCFPKAQ